MSTSTMSEPCSEDRDRRLDIATDIGCDSAKLDADLAVLDGFGSRPNIADLDAF